MTIYLTKVWSFSEPVGPLQFSTEGWRERARHEQLKPGDLVILVGTKNERTVEADRGLILGMMEPTIEPVFSLDFNLPTRLVDFDEQNNYKWPYGLLNHRAWRMIDRKPLEFISDRNFYMDSAQGLVPLTDAEAAKVMELRKEPAQLLEPTIRARARIEGSPRTRKMFSPPPTTMRRGIMHMRRASAFTYAMKVEGACSMAFKVGWAFDYKMREDHFNHAAMPELGGLNYKTVFSQPWDTAKAAYGIEQRLLKYFKPFRHPSNHEIIHGITYDALQAAWVQSVMLK